MSLRARLAVGLTLTTLAIAALVAVAATLLASWRADDPEPQAEAGAARVGDDVTVVVVAERNAADAAAQARRDALGWTLVALGVSVIPAVGVGWFLSARLLGRVEQAQAELDAAEQERQRRLDEVVHELRTPLAIAGTNLELAASDPALRPETGTLIDAARRANDRMRRTVDDLAGHGRLAVDRSAGSLDLVAEARAVVAEHAGPARTRGLLLQARGPATLQLPSGDRAAVRAALGNLVSNAVRLAPRGSTITVACGDEAGWAWIAVTDEGPGLPDHLHARVFERGWRGRHDRDREPQAAPGERGLGLTIARQLTEAQGGVLTLESEEGAGSTFTVWLPLDPQAEEADIVHDDGVHPLVRPWQTRRDADRRAATS
jgi:signal transduction histidine kinase